MSVIRTESNQSENFRTQTGNKATHRHTDTSLAVTHPYTHGTLTTKEGSFKFAVEFFVRELFF